MLSMAERMHAHRATTLHEHASAQLKRVLLVLIFFSLHVYAIASPWRALGAGFFGDCTLCTPKKFCRRILRWDSLEIEVSAFSFDAVDG